MKTIFTFLIAFIFSTAIINAQNQGQNAPDFTLQEHNGGTFKLSDHKGKVVFIFFLGYNCSLCRASAPTLKSTIINTYNNNPDVVLIGIDTWNGNSAGVQNFLNSTGIGIPILKNGSSVANNWSITYDRVAVVDKEGILAFKGTRSASSDANSAKQAIEDALMKMVTSVNAFSENQLFNLEQNFPNPVKNATTIRFSLNEPTNVSLTMHNIAGRLIKEYINDSYSPGNHSFVMKREELNNGIYFYKMKADGLVETRRMVLN